MNKNLQFLLMGLTILVLTFFLGRCTKKDKIIRTTVEKVVEYPVDRPIPVPQIIYKPVPDFKAVDSLYDKFVEYKDSMAIEYQLLASEKILGEVKIVRDTVTDSIFVYVPQKKYSDMIEEELYSLKWGATVTGQLDGISFDVNVNCPQCPKERHKALWFKIGGKSNLDFDVDVPVGAMYESNGWGRGVTYFPREKAIMIDLAKSFRFK